MGKRKGQSDDKGRERGLRGKERRESKRERERAGEEREGGLK